MVETRWPDASTRYRLLVEALEAYALAGGCAADRLPDYCWPIPRRPGEGARPGVVTIRIRGYRRTPREPA